MDAFFEEHGEAVAEKAFEHLAFEAGVEGEEAFGAVDVLEGAQNGELRELLGEEESQGAFGGFGRFGDWA